MQIYNLIQIKEIFTPHYNEKLSVGLSYKIYKLCNSIEQEERFFNQKRQDVIEEFGQKNDDGSLAVNDQGFIQIIAGKEQDAQKALDELTAIDVDMPNITFTLDELSEIKLSVMDMAALEPNIVDE
jgi:hypothetical protein